NHPDVALKLNNLAVLANEQGRHQEALAMLEQSLQIRQKALAADHPDVASSFANIALTRASMNQWDEAVRDMDQSSRITRRYIAGVFSALSEPEQLAFLKNQDAPHHAAALTLAWIARERPGSSETSAAWVINHKGVAQEALAQRALLARSNADPRVAD